MVRCCLVSFHKTVDIIVVGAGTAGLPAAIEGKKLGNEVLILEKAKLGEWRTSLSVIELGLNFCGTEYQKELGIDDSPEKYYEDGIKYCGGLPELWKVYTDHNLEVFQFLEEECGLKFNRGIAVAGFGVPRLHLMDGPTILRALEKKAEELKIPIFYEHKVKELIRDVEGRVIGVVAEYAGELLRFKAKKGVILCTGGFGRNPEMIKEFGPDYLLEATPTMPPTHTGDGILMALKVGAATKFIKHAVVASVPTCVYTKTLGTGALALDGAIFVNKLGNRFYREDAWYGYVGAAISNQPDKVVFMIYDDAIRETVKKTKPHLFRFKEFKADTIKELAHTLGIDENGLEKTIEKYNEDVKTKGQDTVLGRSTLDGVRKPPIPIEKPPFYGAKCCLSTSSFKAGLRIDANARVLNWENKPIPRLYAAGECTGGFFTRGYIAGTMVPMSMVMGRIAARTASQNLPIE